MASKKLSSTATTATNGTGHSPGVRSGLIEIKKLRQELAELRERNYSLEANESERRRALEEAQHLTHLGSWEWDVANNTISWSDELYRIYGLRPQEREVGFEEFMSMIHPEDRERVQGIINTSYQTGKPFEFEHRIIMPKSGRERMLIGMGKVIVDKLGKPQRMIGTSQDVTERKAVERALIKSDERFRGMTNATHDLVFDLDLASGTMWFNEILQSEYGFAKQTEPRSIDWWINLVHPADVLQIREQYAALENTHRQTWSIEYRVRKASGSYAVVRNRSYILRDVSGKPERIVGSCLDITEAKQLERAKDEFISLVSHQLRTPLTIIRLYGNMLSDGIVGPLNDGQSAYIQKITGASIRLIKLVGDILNISRLELNRIKIDSTPGNANELIRGCIDELAPIIEAKQATVSFTPQSELNRMPLDPTIFNEIVHNLVGNALRYGQLVDGKVNVSMTRDERGYHLMVKDNGLGIPATDQPHIFDRFYRAHNAASVDSEGSGLGLYMVKLFTETAGGSVRFKSAVGKGTTFYVTFPPAGMKARIKKPASNT